jgi:CNT family concentrative nucleoside transporter
MGVPWSEAEIMGTLMGEKIALTELIAYGDLRTFIGNGEISGRTAIIASYALCGFANFGSIGIQIGGLGSIAPNRRSDLAKLAFKAMIGGALASWITASIAGILI